MAFGGKVQCPPLFPSISRRLVKPQFADGDASGPAMPAYWSNISGRRRLNSKAMLFPITPSQLTVLTRIWHWLAKMLPVMMAGLGLRKINLGLHLPKSAVDRYEFRASVRQSGRGLMKFGRGCVGFRQRG